MNVPVATYDPKKIIVTWGTTIISGYAEGTFVSIQRNGQSFEKHRGAGGEVERVNKNAYDFTVEITLQQTAAVNAILSAALTADAISNVGVLPLVVKDLLGATLYTFPQAWIAQDPNGEYGDDTTKRTWRFETGISAEILGGN